MRNYAEIIDRLLERFNQGDLSFDDSVACNLFANMRQLIELNNVANTYPILNFYANWCLHPTLDRNSVSQQVLSSIATGLPSSNQVDPTFVDIVCENLGAEKLKNEILSLGTIYGFRDVVSDNQRWLSMYGVLLNLVTYKPLVPPVKLPAGSSLRIAAGTTPLVSVPSTIRLWLHGTRGNQAEWTIAIVPDGQVFDLNNLANVVTFNGGVFAQI